MAKVLIIGCGDLGTAIATRLRAQHEVIGLRISDQVLPFGMQTIQADVTKPNTLAQLEQIKPEILIYCVSAGGQTDEKYQAAYVTGLKNVLATQVNNTLLRHAFFVSSTRVYGQITDAVLDENTPAIASDFGGARLLEAENALKEAQLKAKSWQSTSMRLSGIYGEGRLYLVNMAKDLTKWPQENHWSNRIHRDDAAAFIAFMANKALQNQSLADCYVVSDNLPTAQYEVLIWLAQQQNLATAHINMPNVTGGKRLSNQRMRGTSYVLQYPDFRAGYAKVLQK